MLRTTACEKMSDCEQKANAERRGRCHRTRPRRSASAVTERSAVRSGVTGAVYGAGGVTGAARTPQAAQHSRNNATPRRARSGSFLECEVVTDPANGLNDAEAGIELPPQGGDMDIDGAFEHHGSRQHLLHKFGMGEYTSGV